MSQSLRPGTPLARTTLLKMGARIAVVITFATLFSYLHMLHTLRAEAMLQLQQHVQERGDREEAIFQFAENDHLLLKRALEERLHALQSEDVSARFDSLFVQGPDGATRNRREGFDGTRGVGMFVPRGVRLDAELRRRILAAYDVTAQYGPAFIGRFKDTFMTLPEKAVVSYWPERPNYCLEADPHPRF